MNQATAEAMKSTSISATVYEDYPMPDEIFIEGRADAKVHWLHASAPGEPAYYAGLWTAQPCKFNYEFMLHESAHILEGSVTVTANGETLHLGPGDIAYFPKGTKSVWHITAPLKKIFVDTE